MNRRKRVNADLWILAGLLLLFVALSYKIVGSAPQDTAEGLRPRRTTNSSAREGWKAFYLFLEQSGLPVRRETRAPSEWSKDAKIVICAPEYISLDGAAIWSESEAKAALDWTDRGGTLLLLMDGDNALVQALHLTPNDSNDSLPHDAVGVPAQAANVLHGIRALDVPDGGYWKAKPGRAVELAAVNGQALAITFTHGSGTIIAIASPGMADNAHLGSRDNARFLVQTICARLPRKGAVPGAIVFDEYHQGYADSDSLWGAIGRGGQLAACQLLALVLLIAYAAGRRFGLPRAVPEPARVSSEYVTSLADLYRRAHAGDAALQSLYGVFRRDLCRTAGVAQDAANAEVAAAAAASLAGGDSDLAGRLQQLMDSCAAKISAGAKALPDSELLQLANGLSAMRKELHLGGSDRVGMG